MSQAYIVTMKSKEDRYGNGSVHRSSRQYAFGIAQFFQTTVNDILKYNNIQTPDAIFVGQVLTVPAGSAETQYHVARPGDSLWIIAQMHGTTVDNLTRLNGLSNPNVIYPGQIIKVR